MGHYKLWYYAKFLAFCAISLCDKPKPYGATEVWFYPKPETRGIKHKLYTFHANGIFIFQKSYYKNENSEC